MTSDCSLTVVIPTLGGNVLGRTIESIMAGSVVPQKILIVIPEDRVSSLPNLKYNNVEVLTTKFRGQVQQRIAGFSKSQTHLVMQLDDDIELAYDCIEILIGGMQTCIAFEANFKPICKLEQPIQIACTWKRCTEPSLSRNQQK